jgi:DNA-binding GntR family transcriptional regulator
VLALTDLHAGFYFVFVLGSQLAKLKTSPRAEAAPALPPQTDEAAPRTLLVQDVYERLKREIFEFRMPAGHRYAEQTLANALGVSRTPLRMALHMLAREGYLNRLDGHSSWQVKPLDLEYYDELYDFRTDIEVLAIRRLCEQADLSALDDLSPYWHMKTKDRPTDFRDVAERDEHFHRTIVGLAGNREMLRTYNELAEHIRMVRRLDFVNPDRIDATFTEHGKILDLLIARKADKAEMMMRAHIGASRAEIKHITLHRLSLAAAWPAG